MIEDRGKIRVWALAGDQEAHVRPVESAFGGEAEFIYRAVGEPSDLRALRPDVLICVNDWPYDIARCIDAARAEGVPSLVLQDGILEWRCQYENPLFGSGGGAPQHQPVLADKIACIGNQSARDIGAWGNWAKVEVVGMPRLDGLLNAPLSPRKIPGHRLLVITAKNPGFTEQQRETTLRSLSELKEYLDTRADLTVTWRVGKTMAASLGVESALTSLGGENLTQQITNCDAVITTYSTAMIESMLLDRPVAVLDYHQVPQFVSSAWLINCRARMRDTIDELLNPQARRTAFQRRCLNDMLRTDGAASERAVELIRQMVSLRRNGRRAAKPATFPPNMLGWSWWSAGAQEPLQLDELYPEQDLFQDRDLLSLQARLARLQKDNDLLRRKLSERSLRNTIYSFRHALRAFRR